MKQLLELADFLKFEKLVKLLKFLSWVVFHTYLPQNSSGMKERTEGVKGLGVKLV